MNREFSGKGYVQGGEGVFITSTGERYHYHDGELTRTSVGPWPIADRTRHADLTANAKYGMIKASTKGVIEMKYLGMFELQPLYDSHQSFYGKAFVERYGTRLVLKSYGTEVATVERVGEPDADTEVYEVRIAVRYLSATTLRHVKEFLAQTDDAFRGVTLPWLRKAIKDGDPIDGAGTAWRKVYTLKEL